MNEKFSNFLQKKSLEIKKLVASEIKYFFFLPIAWKIIDEHTQQRQQKQDQKKILIVRWKWKKNVTRNWNWDGGGWDETVRKKIVIFWDNRRKDDLLRQLSDY